MRIGLKGAGSDPAHDAERLKRWETRADEIVIETREIVGRTEGTAVYRRLAEIADDAADALEEAGFHMSLLRAPPEPGGELSQRLRRLADLVAAASQELVKAIEATRYVHRGGARSDTQDFLAAVDRIISLEHETDAAQRRVVGRLVEEAQDFRQMFVIDEIARHFEEAADALLRTALTLRDHVLADVMAG
jgi:uncharacterized protein Yka (UPF0111/DUF47 family)